MRKSSAGFSLWGLVDAGSILAETKFHGLHPAPPFVHQYLSEVQ
jgi:hypothetical protein